MSSTDADVDRTEIPTRPGVRTIYSYPGDLSVTVVIPDMPILCFGNVSPTEEQLAELTQRNRTIAKAMLLDAINQLNRYAPAVPAAMPVQQPGWYS